jgi:mRNA-degrading endonuclease YafQ of YafQ-DinJ toxin-antitoxin module
MGGVTYKGVFKIDLYEEIQRLMAELTASIRKLRDNGAKLAEAERDYKLTLRQEALRLRAGDMPVTLINNIIYGVPEVAEKRFKRDVEQANYDANKEHINVTKLKLRILEAQLAREWGASGKGEI